MASVMCLHSSMQEENIIELNFVKYHLYIYFLSLCNIGVHLITLLNILMPIN